MMMNDRPSILIVDDDDGVRRTLEMILAKKGYQPFLAATGQAALAHARQRSFNLALLDIRLPDTIGTAILVQLKELQPDLEVLIATGHATLESAIQALSAGAYHYFIKPLNVDDLLVTLEKALDKQRLVIENRDLLASAQQELEKRKRVEEASRASDATLQSIFRAAPTGIGLVFNRVLAQVNDRICEMTGRTREELVGKSARILYATTEDFEYVGREKYEQIREHGIGTVETRWQCKDGTVIDVLLSSVPLDPSDLSKGVTFTALDITARKRAENALRAAEASYRSLFENVPDGVYRSTPEGKFLAVNPALVRMLGYASAEELLTVDIPHDLYADPTTRQPWIAQLLQTSELQNAELTMKCKDGRLISVLDHARVIRDGQGNPVCFEGTLSDITTRQQRDRQLQAVAVVSAALRAAPTRAEMLPIVLDQTRILLNAHTTAFITCDLTTGEEVIELARGTWAHATGQHIPVGQSITTHVFETAQPYVTNDLPNDLNFHSRDLIGDLRALANVPLLVQEKPLGLLALGRELPFSDEELQIFIAIADIAASALYRAILREKTEQRLERLVALQTIDQTINASLDLRFTLNVLLDQVVAQLRVDAADILLRHPALQTLDYAAGRGFRAKGIEHLSLRMGEGYAGQVALERRTMAIRHLPPSSEPSRLTWWSGEGLVAYCGVPLIAKGTVQGVLEVFHRAPFNADPEWLNFLETLANQAAVAIDNAQLFEESQRLNTNLILSYDATIEGWSRALELRDPLAEGHTQRVAQLTEQLARAVGIGESDLVHIRRGALLHDIGKLGMPDGILHKSGELTEEEWGMLRRHPEYAYVLFKPIPYLQRALDIPYCHHEKWDGTGYPCGLRGEAIPIAARLFALVDVWDALRSERPYRAAWSDTQAREYIRAQAGKHFDPNLVERFLKIVA